MIALSLPATAQVTINEIMQSNIITVFADNDFPDSWVELYNGGNETVNLKGYTLGIKDSASKGYKIPEDLEIPAQGYALVYCDKEETGLHTSFRLDSGKGDVYLFDPSGNVVSHVSHPKMPAPDLSYALKSADSEEWSYAVTPTPGKANETVFSEQLLPQPEFSVKGGLYGSPVELVISIPEGTPSDAFLCVTLNGREPVLVDKVEGKKYSLTIQDTKIVKGKILSPSALPSWSVTHSYIFHPREITLPVVSLTTDDDFLYDDEIGMLATGLNPDSPNFKQTWRRPVNIEYFPSEEGGAVINQLAETAIQGNSSRQHPQKSMKIYANKRFGTKRLNYAFWKEKPDVAEEVKSISLRNSGNDFIQAHLRDGYIANLFGPNLNVDWMAYQPAIYYLNGQYHGIIDVRERSNEDYIAANYNGLEDIFMIEDWYEMKSGDVQDFYAFKSLYTNPDTPYETLAEKLDMEAFLNYCLAEFYEYNQDFPKGNVVMWRDLLHDGKFRFVLKDLDYTSFQSPEKDFISYLDGTDRPSYAAVDDLSASIFLLCLSYPEFREAFIDRNAVAFGDFLHPDHALALLDEMAEEIEPEYYYHAEKFGLSFDIWKWYKVPPLREFHDGRRNEAILAQLKERYGLGDLYELSFVPKGETRVNGMKLTQPLFDGKMYNNRELRIEAEEKYTLDVAVEHNDGSVSRVTGEKGSVVLTPVDASSISVTFNDNSGATSIIGSNEDICSISVNGMKVKVTAALPVASVSAYGIDGVERARVTEGNILSVPTSGIYLISITLENGKNIVKKILINN